MAVILNNDGGYTDQDALWAILRDDVRAASTRLSTEKFQTLAGRWAHLLDHYIQADDLRDKLIDLMLAVTAGELPYDRENIGLMVVLLAALGDELAMDVFDAGVEYLGESLEGNRPELISEV